MTEMNQEDLKSQLLHLNCNWLFNVPTASHHGGVWERMIKTVRSILDALMLQHRSQLNDDMLITFMAEAEGIVNSRPLYTTEDASLEPLTPAHLLRMKPFVPPPPGNFNRNGRYSRKMWRRVQHLAECFWSRWRKEYVHLLQSRQKWNVTRRNMRIGDVVMVMDEGAARITLELGRVTKVMPGKDELVRKVALYSGRKKWRVGFTSRQRILKVLHTRTVKKKKKKNNCCIQEL
ncbi:uncharacterized protein LOC117100646 [Anneissia japonica]|uniref:uncharacterized protein LOC117100646 n=1 Tax=Anneissia japonica TaxID=1529436 RepID=UPI0014255F30|nr:uncharacterized protein LOC117100646 [Anneissia japonica]